ncbi:hypothetical protein CLOM_g1932 [Closterium sp. NIES-68]|nr:hypothetical protein CLOM_g1932 [Closterium sp. NIES-68]GJP82476.1 hypothetical protein CLOP_g12731 [Closterium sp. NIES-67]
MRRHLLTGTSLLLPLLTALLLCHAAEVSAEAVSAAAGLPLPRAFRGGILRTLRTRFRRLAANRTVKAISREGPSCSRDSAAEGGVVRGYAVLCGDDAVEAQGEEEEEEERWSRLGGDTEATDGEDAGRLTRDGDAERTPEAIAGQGATYSGEGEAGSGEGEVLPSVFEGPQLPHVHGLVTVTGVTSPETDEQEEQQEEQEEEADEAEGGSRRSRRLWGVTGPYSYSPSHRSSRHQQWQQQLQQQRVQKQRRVDAFQSKQQQQQQQQQQQLQWQVQGEKGNGAAPEWAVREQQRWERDQRPQTAEEIQMQEAHWRQQQALIAPRLRQWRQQAKRLVKASRAKEAVWAAEARSKWAAQARAMEREEREQGRTGLVAQGEGVAEAQGVGEGDSVRGDGDASGFTTRTAAGGTAGAPGATGATAGGGRYAVMTADDLDAMMPGGTLSWQRLKATTAAVSPQGSANLRRDKRVASPKAAASPCSPRHSSPVIKVFSSSDIAKRTRYSPSQTVTLVLYRSISLSRGLLFGSNFSCTIFRSRTLPSRLSLALSRSDEPVLRVHNASNILFIGIGLRSSVKNSSPFCESLPEYGALMGYEIICPALHIYRSFGIQFTQAPVLGRIDVFRSGYTKLDSLFVTAPGTYERSPGVIRMGMCGLGMNLTSSKNVITNNDVFGAWELVNLYRGSIGVKVHNNFLHDYLFAGFRCGADVHYSWDCMLTSVKNNFVFTPQSKGRLTFDSAGIYFCTHWFNPGSTVACNYVIGGDHCYYLDYCTSGVDITGGVCAQLWDGVKLNNGKRNKIRSLLMVSLGQSPGYITCLTVTINHCGKDPGTYWERMRQRYYNSPEINKLWPWMKHVCQQTRIGSQSCNPKGHQALTSKQTGACSGLPTENDVELIAVDADTSRSDEYRYCGRVPAANKVNRQVLYRYTGDEMQFRDYKNGDYGVEAGSIVYKKHKGFVSCPRGRVGITPVSVQTYYKDWNIPAPTFYKKMVALSYNVIYNKDMY